MSSFQEVSELFKNEILNSPQYQIGLKIKNMLIQDIQAPHINFKFMYQLQNSDYVDINNKEQEEQVLIFSLKLILGFDVNIYNGLVVIVMSNFIQTQI